jgi:hypothetical protein
MSVSEDIIWINIVQGPTAVDAGGDSERDALAPAHAPVAAARAAGGERLPRPAARLARRHLEVGVLHHPRVSD